MAINQKRGLASPINEDVPSLEVDVPTSSATPGDISIASPSAPSAPTIASDAVTTTGARIIDHGSNAAGATVGDSGSVTASAGSSASIATIGNYIAFTSPTSSSGYHFAAGSTVTVNLAGLHIAGEVMYARAALAAWASVANISFSETSGNAQITITDDNDNVSLTAYTSTSWYAGALRTADVHISQKWYNTNGGYGSVGVGGLNSYGYQTYVHELGHALGLGHAGPYNGSATYGADNIYANDSWQFSTMSYFDQTDFGGASFAYITSAMQADIYGIQLLYGAPVTTNHRFGYNTDAGAAFDLAKSNSFTIYASDHYAYLDGTGYNGAQTINFDAGSFSSMKGLTNNIGLAIDTHLAAYYGGSGIDTVHTGGTANGARSIFGNAGNDYVYSEGSSGTSYNSIDGGAGFDTVDKNISGTNVTYVHANQSANGWLVQGTNTYDYLTNVEALKLSDRTVTLRQAKSNFNFGATNDAGATSDVLLQTGSTVIDWMMQNGVATSGNVITTGAIGYVARATGDFNGDGNADVLLQNGGAVVAWTMRNGTYASGSIITESATGWTVVGTGDFNNDGTQDILLQNGGAVVDWIMSNGAYSSGSVLTDGAAGWTVVGTGDFNGDGTSDILVQNGATVVEWLMSGGAYASGRAISTGAGGWTVRGTGDFNGDGTTDVVLQNGNVVVDWIMSGGAVVDSKVVTSNAGGFTVVGTGDYNGDGTTDLLVQNGATIVSWRMQNGSCVGGSTVSTGASGWSVVT